MAKKSAPKPIEPEFESQELPEEPPARVIEPEPTHAKPFSKADAIRRALAEGLTRAEDALPFIKSHFGHDVTPGHFAASKSREKVAAPAEAAPAAQRRGRPPVKAKVVEVTVKRGRNRKAAIEPTAAAPVEARPTAEPAPAFKNGEADLIATMESLKPLVASLGAEKVKRLVDLLG